MPCVSFLLTRTGTRWPSNLRQTLGNQPRWHRCGRPCRIVNSGHNCVSWYLSGETSHNRTSRERDVHSPSGRHLCKSLSREKTTLLTRATEERANANIFRTHSSERVPLGVGSCLRRTRHLFAVSGPVGPSQKIEFVFSASPETIRREPRECDLLRSVGQLRDLAVCAPCNPVIFFSHSGGLSRRRSVAFCRHELAFPAIHGQQIRDHLPRYG
jgi:hypothetical protein